MTLPVSTATASAATASVTVNKPGSNWVSGNTLIAIVGASGSGTLGTPTAPSGWVLVQSGSATAHVTYAVFILKLTSAGAASYTFSTTGTPHSAAIIGEYSSTQTAGTVDASSTKSGSSGTTATWTAITTAAANEIVIAAGASQTSTITTPTGYTNEASVLYDGAVGNIYLFDLQQASAGSTGSPTATIGASAPWWTVLLALNPPAKGSLDISSIGVFVMP